MSRREATSSSRRGGRRDFARSREEENNRGIYIYIPPYYTFPSCRFEERTDTENCTTREIYSTRAPPSCDNATVEGVTVITSVGTRGNRLSTR